MRRLSGPAGRRSRRSSTVAGAGGARRRRAVAAWRSASRPNAGHGSATPAQLRVGLRPQPGAAAHVRAAGATPGAAAEAVARRRSGPWCGSLAASGWKADRRPPCAGPTARPPRRWTLAHDAGRAHHGKRTDAALAPPLGISCAVGRGRSHIAVVGARPARWCLSSGLRSPPSVGGLPLVTGRARGRSAPTASLGAGRVDDARCSATALEAVLPCRPPGHDRLHEPLSPPGPFRAPEHKPAPGGSDCRSRGAARRPALEV
jgi:hypothetical protein